MFTKQMSWQRRPVFIAGVGISHFGYLPDVDSIHYASQMIMRALKDAEMEWKDIQAVFCGTCYLGPAIGHKIIKEVGLTGIPIVNMENACSTGASALRLAYMQIAAEIYDAVLIIGVEKNPKGPLPSVSFTPWEMELGFNFQPGNYALETVKYMDRTGATEEDFSLVTVKNRKNASLNPNARYQNPVTLAEVMNSRMVAAPLRLLHCCPLADGAAVAVVCAKNKLKSPNRAVRVEAAIHRTAAYKEEYAPGGIIASAKFPAKKSLAALSAHDAFEMSSYGPEDIDLAQVYDTVSSSELWDIEELGFCGEGRAPTLLRDGVFNIDGKLPVNTDGGLMGRGHPMAATSLAQIIEIVTQLRKEAAPRQVENARIGLTHAMGAGPNSTVTILAKNE
jgi:acetyl-CoA acetyltransferase